MLKKVLILVILPLLILIAGCSTSNVAILPSSTTDNGESLYVLSKDNNGNTVRNTVFSERLTGTKIPFVLVQFQYNLADYDIIIDKTGTTNAIQNNSEMILSTGTGLGEIHVESRDAVRYQPGAESYALFTASFTTGGVDGTEQFIGLTNNDEDGYFLGYNNTNFVVGLLDNGVRELYDESTFIDRLDGTGASGCNIDKRNLIIYRISFGWLGIAPISFEVFCGSEIGWVNFATIDKTNTQIIPTNSNPVLPMHVHLVKTSGTQNVEFRTASWNAGIINGGIGNEKRNPASRFFSHVNDKSIASDTLTNIITLNSTTTFFGKTNRIESKLDLLSVSSEGTKPVRISILKNCDLDGTQVWNRQDINNSVMSYDVNSTTLSNCEPVADFTLAKEDSLVEQINNLEIKIEPGELLTIAAISTSASNIIASIRWEELF